MKTEGQETPFDIKDMRIIFIILKNLDKVEEAKKSLHEQTIKIWIPQYLNI